MPRKAVKKGGSDRSVLQNILYRNNVGIDLASYSDYNHLINNTCFKNEYGSMIWQSRNNTITNNTMVNNTQGIFMYENCDYNMIWNNNFINNSESQCSVYDSTGNQWYYEETGNYWDDYITRYPTATNDNRVWTIAYSVPGNSGANDLHPLVNHLPYQIPISIQENVSTTIDTPSDSGDNPSNPGTTNPGGSNNNSTSSESTITNNLDNSTDNPETKNIGSIAGFPLVIIEIFCVIGIMIGIKKKS